jgi:hypothetical protein
MRKSIFNSFILLKNVKCTKRLVITTCVCNIIKVAPKKTFETIVTNDFN